MSKKYKIFNKHFLFFLAIVISFTFISSVWAGEFTVFGPKTYIRETSGPKAVNDNFSVLNTNTNFTLRLINGDLEDSAIEKVSSSVIYLNGQKLIGPENFNQNVNYLELPLSLNPINNISVEVRSKPGGKLVAKIIGKDETPPSIQIVTPVHNSLLETKTTSANIILTDGISGINPATFKAVLNSQDVTSSFILPEYSLSTLSITKTDLTLEEGENTLEVSVSDFANNGSVSVSKFTLRTSPPILPTSGFIHGQVFDSRANLPLIGASVTANGIQGTLYTDEQGKFAFPTPGTGEFELTIQKPGYTFAQRKVKVVSTRDIAVEPIYLMPLDAQITTITPEGGTATNSTGTVVVNVPASAISMPIEVIATQYQSSRDLPSPLPQTSHFTYALDLEPDGAEFNTQVEVKIKNELGFRQGTPIPVGYWNRQTLQWEHESMAYISQDGQWVVFYINHFSPRDINLGVIPPAKANPPFGIEGKPPANLTKANIKKTLEAKDPGISLRSGELSINHTLPAFRSLGNLQSIAFNYNSSSVNPNALIGAETFLYDREYLRLWLGMVWGIPGWVPVVYSIIPQTITAKFELEGKTQETKFQGTSGPATQRFFWDAKNARDELLPTGSYPYKITLSDDYEVNFATANYFAGPAVSDTGIKAPELRSLSVTITERVIVNNQIDSPFGAGWTLQGLQRLHFDPDGKIVLTEGDGSAVIFSPISTGMINTIAGTGVNGYSGDGSLAVNAKLNAPYDVVVDNSGNIFISDSANHSIRKIDTNGIITTVVGSAVAGFSGDGGLAINAQLNNPKGIYIDNLGNLYIADNGNYRVRKVDTNGIITTIAGTGIETRPGGFTPGAHPGDGGPAINAEIAPIDLCVDKEGNLFVIDSVYGGSVIRKIDINGIIIRVGINKFADNLPATPPFGSSSQITIDNLGNLFIADSLWRRIRKLDTNGILSTVAGISYGDDFGYSGDGGPARNAELNSPRGIAIDDDGNLFFSDIYNHCVRKVDSDGIITTIAGTGIAGFSGDGDLAPFAQLSYPQGICIDKAGNLLIADFANHRIRKIDFSQTQSSVYKPLEADYSYLIKNNRDNTYKRMMKDGVVHNFNSQGLLLSSVDRNGNTTTYNYDPEGKLVDIIDSVGQTIYFDYDSSGHLISITDPAERITRFLIDSYGDLVQIINPNGATKKFTYNDKHLLISETDQHGFKIEYIYDEFGRVKEAGFPQGEVIKFQSSDTQGIVNSLPTGVGTPDNPATIVRPEEASAKVIDGNNNATVYFTNRFGSITKQTDALGRTTSIDRDINSNPTKIILPNIGTIPLEYDLRGNLIWFVKSQSPWADFLLQTLFTYEPKFNQITRISSPNGTTEITYDDKGNPIHIANTSYGYSINDTGLTYDTRGLVKNITNARGKITQFNYDDKGNLISITDPLANTAYLTYDLAGNVTSYKDALGRITQFEYDLMNRLISVTDPIGAVTRYEYDSIGNLTKIIDANLDETTFEYDPVNQLVKITNPLGQSKTFNYDLNRNLTSIIDAKSQIINFQYDAANQLIKKLLPDDIVNFVYDVNGRLIEASDSDSKLKFSYISISQLSQVDTGDPLNPALQQPITSTKYAYTYWPPAGPWTASGQLRKMTLPDNSTVSYDYDNFKRLERILFTKPNIYSTYAYFSYDNLNRRVYDSTGKYHFYDDNNQLISLKDSYYGPVRYQYAYDALGNRISMTDSAGIHNYTYDSLNRLLSSTNPTELFTYDSLGNRLSSTLNPTYTYDNYNRLLDDGQYTYTYDANGNLTDITNQTDKTFYTYSSENQLLRIDYPDGTYSTYRYDALGRRIEKDVNGVVRRYVYDNEDIIAEYDGSNTLIATYLHGPGIDEPIMMERQGQRYYYLIDGLGSIVGLTDYSGRVLQTYSYDSFGNIIAQTGSLENPYTYTGREYNI